MENTEQKLKYEDVIVGNYYKNTDNTIYKVVKKDIIKNYRVITFTLVDDCYEGEYKWFMHFFKDCKPFPAYNTPLWKVLNEN